jgi:hypothetical protein
VFLLSISFIPFPTSLLGEYGDLRFAVVVYALSVGLARFLLAVVWWYVIKGPIRIGGDLDRGLARYHFARSLAIPTLFLVSIGISFFSVKAAIASWFLMFVADAATWRLWRRRRTGGVRGAPARTTSEVSKGRTEGRARVSAADLVPGERQLIPTPLKALCIFAAGWTARFCKTFWMLQRAGRPELPSKPRRRSPVR